MSAISRWKTLPGMRSERRNDVTLCERRGVRKWNRGIYMKKERERERERERQRGEEEKERDRELTFGRYKHFEFQLGHNSMPNFFRKLLIFFGKRQKDVKTLTFKTLFNFLKFRRIARSCRRTFLCTFSTLI